jgi:hypothetical protein
VQSPSDLGSLFSQRDRVKIFPRLDAHRELLKAAAAAAIFSKCFHLGAVRACRPIFDSEADYFRWRGSRMGL